MCLCDQFLFLVILRLRTKLVAVVWYPPEAPQFAVCLSWSTSSILVDCAVNRLHSFTLGNLDPCLAFAPKYLSQIHERAAHDPVVCPNVTSLFSNSLPPPPAGSSISTLSPYCLKCLLICFPYLFTGFLLL